jgi:hypothetical protein
MSLAEARTVALNVFVVVELRCLPLQLPLSLAAKQDVSGNDPRVVRARGQMAKAIKATGETEQAVAAACTRAARFIFDATKSPATSVEVLDALAEKGAGRPMSDTIGRYVEARRNSAGKTHAEAMAALK